MSTGRKAPAFRPDRRELPFLPAPGVPAGGIPLGNGADSEKKLDNEETNGYESPS
jgi:hypothetical protein